MNDVSKAINIVGGCLAGVVACMGSYAGWGLVLPYLVTILLVTPVIAALYRVVEELEEIRKEEEGRNE